MEAEEPQVTGAANGAANGTDHPVDQVARLTAEEVEPRRRRVATRVVEEMVDRQAGRPQVETAILTQEETAETLSRTRTVKATADGTHS